jgi:hypothetical protein
MSRKDECAVAMPDRLPPEHEQPLSCLNRHGIDPLLLRLRAVFGEAGRPDIASEIARAAARRVEAAAELVPAG